MIFWKRQSCSDRKQINGSWGYKVRERYDYKRQHKGIWRIMKLSVLIVNIVNGSRHVLKGFPGGSDGKESPCNAGDTGSIPGSGRYPGRMEWLLTPVLKLIEVYIPQI